MPNMNQSLTDFLAVRLPFAGLLGWMARTGDEPALQQWFVEGPSPAKTQQIFANLAATAASLAGAGIDSDEACWVFERLRFYLVRHPNDAWLLLVTENRPEVPPAAKAITSEFRQLALS
jgi:hypothetical protein